MQYCFPDEIQKIHGNPVPISIFSGALTETSKITPIRNFDWAIYHNWTQPSQFLSCSVTSYKYHNLTYDLGRSDDLTHSSANPLLHFQHYWSFVHSLPDMRWSFATSKWTVRKILSVPVIETTGTLNNIFGNQLPSVTFFTQPFNTSTQRLSYSVKAYPKSNVNLGSFIPMSWQTLKVIEHRSSCS